MNFKKIILYVSLVVLAAMAYFGYKVYSIVFIPNTSFNQSEVSVYIPTNSNYEEVKEILSPFLKDMDKFTALAEQKKYNTNVKAGKFILKKDMNTNAIISALRNSVPIKVTFNNQERVEDLAARISTQIEADSTSLMNAFTDESFLKENGFTSENVLAMFIPNTFEFYWNTSAEKFRDKLAKEYIKFWNDERKAKAEKQGLTPIEVSILASIVHKETAKIDERSKVAGVYLNRLKKGMPLQADPTVIYSVKKVNNDFGIVIKRVLNKDLVVNSPYNTYQNAGLPPGPIFMSDVSALEAVLNPEQHNYIYFCASVTNFGYHEFAATVSEHQANARKYYDWLNKQGLMR
jgi:UPF0755 protein